MGLEFPGFVAPLVIRAFPFITDLPVKSIQAQGEIKTIIKNLGYKIVEERKEMGTEKGGCGAWGTGKDLLSVFMRMSQSLGAGDEADYDIDQLLDHVRAPCISMRLTPNSWVFRLDCHLRFGRARDD